MTINDLISHPHRHGKNSTIIDQQQARIAALERVLRRLTDQQPGAPYRRFDETYARYYCNMCGGEWPVGEEEIHGEFCPVDEARNVLRGDDE